MNHATDPASEIHDAAEAVAAATSGPEQPVTQSKWYQWRKSGTALIAYLLDSEVHTFAFSVAANAIISFIPFIVLLYTLVFTVFHSPTKGPMVTVVNNMVNYFLPSLTKEPDWLTKTIVAEGVEPILKHHGAQAFSLLMILIACTGIFLPLEVALNQAWGVNKSRNYLFNQTIAFGLALLMLGLAVASMLANVAVDKCAASDAFWCMTEQWFYRFECPVARGLCVAGNFDGRRFNFVFLFGVLHFAEPQGAVAAGAAHIDDYRHCVAAIDDPSLPWCCLTST